MFTREKVTLRPLELEDIGTLYRWETDIQLSYFSGWVPKLSRCAYYERWEDRLKHPPADIVELGIVYDGMLVGFIQLALIDMVERRAAIGIVIGEKDLQGQGIGSMAVKILCDYAFTVKGLEKVYAESYGFNTRSQHMFERAGFQREGILRQHECHNGVRQDMYFYGMLRDEFYAQNETIFKP